MEKKKSLTSMEMSFCAGHWPSFLPLPLPLPFALCFVRLDPVTSSRSHLPVFNLHLSAVALFEIIRRRVARVEHSMRIDM